MHEMARNASRLVEQFNVENMAEGYAALYRKAVQRT
jgi:hypothetical protein